MYIVFTLMVSHLRASVDLHTDLQLCNMPICSAPLPSLLNPHISHPDDDGRDNHFSIRQAALPIVISHTHSSVSVDVDLDIRILPAFCQNSPIKRGGAELFRIAEQIAVG